MEEKVINFLFEKGYLNMDKIIEDFVNIRTDFTTYTLLKKVEEVIKSDEDWLSKPNGDGLYKIKIGK